MHGIAVQSRSPRTGLEGENAGCSFPTEAIGFDGMWDELQQRLASFDYGHLLRGGTDDAKYLCCKRQASGDAAG
jgi:hypothetical protein